MVRLSKQQRDRSVSPRRPALAGVKTGPRKDNLPEGFKGKVNAIQGDLAATLYIAKIR